MSIAAPRFLVLAVMANGQRCRRVFRKKLWDMLLTLGLKLFPTLLILHLFPMFHPLHPDLLHETYPSRIHR